MQYFLLPIVRMVEKQSIVSKLHLSKVLKKRWPGGRKHGGKMAPSQGHRTQTHRTPCPRIRSLNRVIPLLGHVWLIHHITNRSIRQITDRVHGPVRHRCTGSGQAPSSVSLDPATVGHPSSHTSDIHTCDGVFHQTTTRPNLEEASPCFA